ncbi:MAG: hydroxyacylglutathione hydrolase [Dehalococcoidia bacterium]|jgi:hydroxyacylglutathione hydrolase|nr:hydroxyacylglutathione hydrolase [Dehalococcoidia bacterium]
MHSVAVIGTLADNLTYVLERDGGAVVIDPGEASPVLRHLGTTGSKLLAVLCTHGHFDHIAGIGELVAGTSCDVVQPGETDAGSDDRVTVGSFMFTVLRTPGHSTDSVCLYLPGGDGAPGDVFTGDTLFVGGCGRLLTRSPQTMWASLEVLAALPGETGVYPGHDYTLENYEFALTLEPDNREVRQRLQQVRALVEAGKQAVPSTIREERATNPFLRAGDPALKAALGMPHASDVDAFAEIRRRKDRF